MSFKESGKHVVKRPDRDLILMGIFEDQENGILMIENPLGMLQLPGGKIRKYSSPDFFQKQLENEIIKLQKVVFEKSGLLLDVVSPIIVYDIMGKMCKIYLLSQKSNPLNGVPWKRDTNYHAYYIMQDETLITANKAIPDEDKIILLDYLQRKRRRLPKPNQPCEVKTIA